MKFRIATVSGALIALVCGTFTLARAENKAGTNLRPNTTEELRFPLNYQYDYIYSFTIQPGVLQEASGLPERLSVLTVNDSAVEMIIAEGVISVQCDGKQLYVRNDVTRATGKLTGAGGTKDVSHRLAEHTEYWLFGDPSVTSATSGRIAGGPEGYKLEISDMSSFDSLLTNSTILPELAAKFQTTSFVPTGRKGAAAQSRDIEIDCEEITRIEHQTEVENAIAYETRVPLSAVAQGDVSDEAESVTLVTEDAQSGLPLEVESLIESGSERSTMTSLPMGYQKYEWSSISGTPLPKLVVAATSFESVEYAKAGKWNSPQVLPPSNMLVLRLKSASAGAEAEEGFSIPILPDTKIIQDNTSNPPRTIRP